MTITLDIQQLTTCIALHSASLSLSPSLLTQFGNTLIPNKVTHLDAAQITIFYFAETISPQFGAQLAISFSGNFNNVSASGFFLSNNVFNPSSLERERKEEAFAGWSERRNKKKERKGEEGKRGGLNLVAGQKKMFATQVCYYYIFFIFLKQ